MPDLKVTLRIQTSKKSYQNGPKLLEAGSAHKIGDIKNAESLYLNSINSGFEHEVAFSNLELFTKRPIEKKKLLPCMSAPLPKTQALQRATQI